MNKEFIPYEQALELKELGFNEKCVNHYSEHNGESLLHLMSTTPVKNESFITYKGCAAPLYQQAFRWFREKYNLFSVIDVDQTMEPLFCYSLSKYKGNFQWDNILPTYSELYYTYEEAELACLKKLIEIVKNK
jgi:hypothetical protein